MTEITGTDLTTDAVRNWVANHEIHPEARRLLLLLAGAYDTSLDNVLAVGNATLLAALATAKSVADRDKYNPQESAAAWDVVDALTALRSSGEHVTADPDADEHDGKEIARAAEAEDPTDECD